MRKPAAKPAPRGTTKKHAGGTKHPAGSGVQHGHLAGGKHHPAKQHKSAAPAHKPAQTTKQAHVIHGHPVKGPAPKKPSAKGTKKRTLTPGSAGLCSAEALAASLRLSGRRVGADDVLALYWHTAHTPDAGASILATLKAASEYGLAGIRPDWFGPIDVRAADIYPGSLILGAELPGPHSLLAEARGWWSWGDLHDPACWPDAVTEEAWTVRWPAWL